MKMFGNCLTRVIFITLALIQIGSGRSRLRVRRVRATTLPPLLINWGSISDLIDSPDSKDPDIDNVASASDLSFSGSYLAPPLENVSEEAENITEETEEQSEAEFILPTVDEVSEKPKCSIVEETVYNDVTEEQCRTDLVKSCNVTPAECNIVTRYKCDQIIETQYQEICNDVTMNICENVLQNRTRRECKNIADEKCEYTYQTELKDECKYEAVLENVCATGYSVAYEDKCKVVPQTQCKVGKGCRRVPKRLCAKVPKFPSEQCRYVPRVEGKCKKVPVKRPAKTCAPTQREVCEEVPYQEIVKQCFYSTKPECKQVPQDVVRNDCKQVDEEVCSSPVETCQTVPTTYCEDKVVQKPSIVQKEVCE